MIAKNTLEFLSDLAENNSRDWFDQNRDLYKEAKTDFEDLVNTLINEIALFDPLVSGLEAKKCVFRLFRDVRFSKDKVPYKTNFGASISPGGRKAMVPGYYLHIEPGGESFLAGGMYMPMPENLKKLRESIDYDDAPLRKIINHKDFKRYFGAIEGDQVKTAPKGYAKDHPAIDLIRYKSFIMVHKITDAKIKKKDFVEEAMVVYKAMKPFNDYVREAISFES